jgi:hypothetical protein
MSLFRPAIDEVRLARWAREQASGLSALFHGTRHLSCILSDGYLKPTGNPAMVRFSRSADAAGILGDDGKRRRRWPRSHLSSGPEQRS